MVVPAARHESVSVMSKASKPLKRRSLRLTNNWRERWRTLSYTQAAVVVGLIASLLMGAVHINTLNFWLTSLLALTIVTIFDCFVLAMLDDEQVTPSKLLFRMMLFVVLMQTAFAGIYHWASNASSFLERGGVRVTDFVDAVYFSGVTLLTVGYGDVIPRGDFRFTAVAEVYGGTLFVFTFFGWIMASRTGRGKS